MLKRTLGVWADSKLGMGQQHIQAEKKGHQCPGLYEEEPSQGFEDSDYTPVLGTHKTESFA